MTKNGYIHGFSELYSYVYLCKIAVSLAGQGIEGDCVFVYGYIYAMCVCICAWICGFMQNMVLKTILSDIENQV